MNVYLEATYMAETPSTMIPLGTVMPDFSLPDFSNTTISKNDLRHAKGVLIAFICNHCPFVKHIQYNFAQLAKEYQAKDIKVLAINSNDTEHYPDDRPERMEEVAKAVGYTFPYLYDETQNVAKRFKAACTPDFFLFDSNLKLVYRGQMDDSRPSNGRPNDGTDLRAALDRLLVGAPPLQDQKPSVGCNIKWKLGNEPEYFG